MMMNEADVLRDVVGKLERAGIEYRLTGSMAMTYYAQPRMTRDLDLVVALSEADAERIVSVFEPDYYVPRQAVITALRRRVSFGSFDLWIVGKEDLILSKLFWARDSHSQMQLRDVRNLLSTGYDQDYLDEWAAKLGVAHLWQECLGSE